MKMPGFSAGIALGMGVLRTMAEIGTSGEHAGAVIPQLCASSPCISNTQVQCCVNFQFGWPPVSAGCTVNSC